MIIVLVLYMLSYLSRLLALWFVWDLVYSENPDDRHYFAYLMIWNATFIFDGVSFMGLLIIHFKNFKP